MSLAVSILGFTGLGMAMAGDVKNGVTMIVAACFVTVAQAILPRDG